MIKITLFLKKGFNKTKVFIYYLKPIINFMNTASLNRPEFLDECLNVLNVLFNQNINCDIIMWYILNSK